MIKSSVSLVILIVLIPFLAPRAIGCPTDEKSLQRAQQIWEAAVSAKGGRERILNIKNFLTYNEKRTSIGLSVFPDKFWWWVKDQDPIGLNVKTYDFFKNIGYRIKKGDPDNFSFPLRNQTKELILSRLLPDLLETKWIKPKLIGSYFTKINGRDFDVVCVEIIYPDNQVNQKIITDRHDYVFDQQTHLLFRDVRYFDKTIGGGYLTTEYSNYVEIKGIKFATKNKSKYDHDRKWTSGGYMVEIDVDYREDLFDKPPSIKEGPDGWKKNP